MYNGILCSLKRKDILSHATTWMNLEDKMLCGISQTKKEKSCMPYLCMGSKEAKYTETQGMVVSRKELRGTGDAGQRESSHSGGG